MCQERGGKTVGEMGCPIPQEENDYKKEEEEKRETLDCLFRASLIYMSNIWEGRKEEKRLFGDVNVSIQKQTSGLDDGVPYLGTPVCFLFFFLPLEACPLCRLKSLHTCDDTQGTSH